MTAAGNSQPFQGVAATYQPAFFQFSFQSTIYAVATHVDFSVAAGNGTLGTPTIPAKPGETIILWGTGFGPTTPAAPVGVEVPPTGFVTASNVTATIGGQPAAVSGAALSQGFAALYQIVVTVPAGLANGDYPIVATINGAASPGNVMLTAHQ